MSVVTVLEGALRAALDEMMWELEGLALAERFDSSTGAYEGLASYQGGSIAQLHDHVLVVHPKVAAAQQQKATDASASAPAEGTTTTSSSLSGTSGTPSVGDSPEAPQGPKDTRFTAPCL